MWSGNILWDITACPTVLRLAASSIRTKISLDPARVDELAQRLQESEGGAGFVLHEEDPSARLKLPESSVGIVLEDQAVKLGIADSVVEMAADGPQVLVDRLRR